MAKIEFKMDAGWERAMQKLGTLYDDTAEGTHPAIIDRSTFENAQAMLETNRKSNNISKDTPLRYPFSGMIQCGHCGRKFKRVVCHGKPYWQCTTYLRNGKAACPAKQIPENILLALSAHALGLAVFDGAAFAKQIQELRIPSPDRVGDNLMKNVLILCFVQLTSCGSITIIIDNI